MTVSANSGIIDKLCYNYIRSFVTIMQVKEINKTNQKVRLFVAVDSFFNNDKRGKLYE